jgi:hypothetical protein
MTMTKAQRKGLAELKQQRSQMVKELRACHDGLLKGKNNVETILNGLIFLFEADEQIAAWDAVK